MERWLCVTIYVCLYGCMKEIRPATHFLTQYLEGPWVNLTHTQVNNEVYPVWTYSYLVFLPAIFLMTVWVRYKPFIILESGALVVTWILLTWGRGLLLMQFMQVAFGVATAADVAYYTYIYAQVPRSKFRKVTSFTRAAVWVGKLLSAVAAQVLVSARLMDYSTLNYLSFACVIFAFSLALFLPRIRSHEQSSDEQRKDAEQPLQGNGEAAKTKKVKTWKEHAAVVSVCNMVYEIKQCYSDRVLLQWSVWWALATCGNLQVGNYIQPLWEEIYPAQEHEDLYHGAVDAVKMFLGIVVTMAMGFLHVDWNRFGELTLGIVSLIEAIALYIMAETTDIWLAYGTACLFKVSHQMLITIASYQVAKDLTKSTRPLLFGANTFFSALLHALLTIIVVDKRGLGLSPRPQFVVYASYFFTLGFVFLIIMLIRKWLLFRKQRLNSEPELSQPPLSKTENEVSC